MPGRIESSGYAKFWDSNKFRILKYQRMLFYWLSTKSKQLMSFLQLAWAPGKGVKGKEYKEYFDTEQGVAYIPWKKLGNGVDFQALSDGGWIDPETLPPGTQNTSKEGQFILLLSSVSYCII